MCLESYDKKYLTQESKVSKNEYYSKKSDNCGNIFEDGEEKEF